jgi:hypothetical protein
MYVNRGAALSFDAVNPAVDARHGRERLLEASKGLREKRAIHSAIAARRRTTLRNTEEAGSR